MISFVGAGPGAADLITLRGKARLEGADVVVWASSLVPEALLSHARREARVYDSKSMTLEDVLAVYEEHSLEAIVRLHSGDPSVYGAVQEQVDWCVENERDFEIVPGVSSFAAAAAALGRELTVPTVSQSIVLTRLARRTATSMPERESVAAFSAIGATMAIFLSAAHPRDIQRELLREGSSYDEETPAAVVVRASWPDEKIAFTTVGDLARTLEEIGAKTTVLVLVGRALGAAEHRSRLYSPGFAHKYRRRSLPGTTSGRPA